MCGETQKTLRLELAAYYTQIWKRFRYDLRLLYRSLVCPLVHVPSRIAASVYGNILNGKDLTLVGILLPNTVVFQDDNTPIHTCKKVQCWFEEHRTDIKHLLQPTQFSNLNVIESL